MRLLARLSALCAILLVAFATFSPADAQSRAPAANSKPRVYLLRGLANIFSLGMDDMAKKLNARGITATVHSYVDWQTVSAAAVAEARATGGRKPAPVVIIGHSLGADAAVYMGNKVSGEGVPVPLVVTFDPVTPTTASAGIGRVVNFYVASGSGKPVAGPKVQNLNMSGNDKIGHFNIDKLASLQDQVINMIDRPAPRPRRPRPAAPQVSAPPAAPSVSAPVATPAAPTAALLPDNSAPTAMRASAAETAAAPAAVPAPVAAGAN